MASGISERIFFDFPSIQSQESGGTPDVSESIVPDKVPSKTRRGMLFTLPACS
jgi:hypothetical protein